MSKSRVHIRYLIRRDMPEVLAIEHASFDHPWCHEDFLRVLRQYACIGMVAENGERIVGFMVYERKKRQGHLLNFATHPDWRRQGVGMQMVDKLVDKMHDTRRPLLTLQVRETNLEAQQFFRSQHFVATEVVRGHFEDTGEDAYAMDYRIPEHPEAPVGGRNARGLR